MTLPLGAKRRTARENQSKILRLSKMQKAKQQVISQEEEAKSGVWLLPCLTSQREGWRNRTPAGGQGLDSSRGPF